MKYFRVPRCLMMAAARPVPCGPSTRLFCESAGRSSSSELRAVPRLSRRALQWFVWMEVQPSSLSPGSIHLVINEQFQIFQIVDENSAWQAEASDGIDMQRQMSSKSSRTSRTWRERPCPQSPAQMFFFMCQLMSSMTRDPSSKSSQVMQHNHDSLMVRVGNDQIRKRVFGTMAALI